MDINKIWLSGTALTAPTLTRAKSKTDFATFTLQVNERYRAGGSPRVRVNLIRVEGLGRGAEIIMEKVKEGGRYFIDGYLRQDPSDQGDYVRVRAFAVHKEDSAESESYYKGLSQALTLMKKSRDLPVAMKKIEELVHSRH